MNYRLGEACSHIATVLTCIVKAGEARMKSGSDACTSQKCMWLPPARNVSLLLHKIGSYLPPNLYHYRLHQHLSVILYLLLPPKDQQRVAVVVFQVRYQLQHLSNDLKHFTRSWIKQKLNQQFLRYCNHMPSSLSQNLVTTAYLHL